MLLTVLAPPLYLRSTRTQRPIAGLLSPHRVTRHGGARITGVDHPPAQDWHSSVDVRVCPVEVVVQLPPLRGMNVERREVARLDPGDFACLVVDGGLPADRAGEQDHLVLLPDLPVAVLHDMPRVGEDPEDTGDLDQDAGLLTGLTDGALGGGLAQLHLAHRQGPLPSVASALEQHPPLLVCGQYSA